MTENPLSVLVPASTSNLGAGFDCLGVALDLWLEARIVPGDGPPSYRGTLVGLTPERDIVHQLLTQASALNGHRLVMRSEIPVANGLGSSAAAAVAAVTLAALARGEQPDKDAVLPRSGATGRTPGQRRAGGAWWRRARHSMVGTRGRIQ